MNTPIATLYRGSNRLIRIPLYLEDGTTAIAAASLSYASVALYQGVKLIDTYVRGTDAELRNGDTSNELELELTSALTNQLAQDKPLTGLITLKVTDTDFTAEPNLFIDRQPLQLATTVK